MAKGGYQKRRIEEKHRQEREARKRATQRKKLLTGLVVVVILALIGGVTFIALTGDEADLFAEPTPAPTEAPTPQTTASFSEPCTNIDDIEGDQKTFQAPPCKIIDESGSYTATFETSEGTVEVELLAGDAPVTVNNFVFLARVGFYDGSVFHRVIPDFGGPGSNMVQGGDAVNMNGTGNPGYAFGDENFRAFDSPGWLAMANSGPGSNGSQFFFLDGPVGHLNAPGNCPGPSGCHSVFGRVIDGMDVIAAIAGAERDASDRPAKDIVIERVTITEG